MKNKIAIFAGFLLINLLNAQEYDFYLKKDGWDIPKIEDFNSIGEKQHLFAVTNDSPFKNCYIQYFSAKKEINITYNKYKQKLFKNEMKYLELETIKLNVTNLGVYYYNDKPYCYQFVNKIKDEIIQFVDMDLDGIFELDYPWDATEYFLKFSTKVSEEDRYKKPIRIGNQTIK